LIDKDGLEQFIDVMTKRDDEAFCLMRYTRQDDVRIKVRNRISKKSKIIILFKELTAQLERYSEKSLKLKRASEEEIIEFSSLQIELDKIAETFRRSHAQRQQLIKRWETILIQMQRKDHEIDTLAIVSESNSSSAFE
jgi:hypothetical protein